jgi:hypothetical protein
MTTTTAEQGTGTGETRVVVWTRRLGPCPGAETTLAILDSDEEVVAAYRAGWDCVGRDGRSWSRQWTGANCPADVQAEARTANRLYGWAASKAVLRVLREQRGGLLGGVTPEEYVGLYAHHWGG